MYIDCTGDLRDPSEDLDDFDDLDDQDYWPEPAYDTDPEVL